MAETLKANMIVPEVWGDMVQAEFSGRLVIASLAISNDTLAGAPGDTIHFPKFNALSDATDLTEAVAMTTEALTTSDDTATIKEIGKAVEITDTALLTAYGDPLGEIRRQLGIVVARKMDTDLTTEAVSAGALTYTAATPIAAGAIAAALGEFGDDADPRDFAALVIHSKQKTALFQDDDFTRHDSAFGDQNVVIRGLIGDIYGIPVIVSDRVPVVAGTPDTYKALLIKRGALGIIWKRRPIVETDRDILKRTQVITTNVHYAVKRLNDSGVLVLTTQ